MKIFGGGLEVRGGGDQLPAKNKIKYISGMEIL